MDMTADHISDIMNISGNGCQFTGVCVVSEFLENFSGIFRHVISMTFAVFCVADDPQKFICLFYVYFDVRMIFYLFQSNHFFILQAFLWIHESVSPPLMGGVRGG